jgi:hypothetical protein
LHNRDRFVKVWRRRARRPGHRSVLSAHVSGLEKRGQVCKLTVVHELEHAPKTAKHVANGWSIVLAGLKTLLETGRPMPMPEPM